MIESVKELVDNKDWSAIASLLCSGKPMDIANYSILLPDNFQDYIKTEAKALATKDIEVRVKSLRKSKQRDTESREDIEKWKQEELNKISKDPKIEDVASKIKLEVESSKELMNNYDKEIKAAKTQAREARRQYNEAKGSKNADRKGQMERFKAELQKANENKKLFIQARDGAIAENHSLVQRLSEQYNSLVAAREIDINKAVNGKLLKLTHFESEENRLKVEEIKLSRQLAQSANRHIAETSTTSINHLISEGRIEEVLSYVHEGAGKGDEGYVLDAIVKAGKVNELISAVSGRPELRSSIFNEALKSQNFGLANALHDKKISFELLVISSSHVNDGESLIRYFNAFDNKTTASKSTAKILAFYLEDTVNHVRNLDSVFHDNKILRELIAKLETNPSVDDKINIASILADAMTEIDNGKLNPEQKVAAKAALERVYQGSCYIEGQENPLGVILKKYDEKGVYNALKVATHEKFAQAGGVGDPAQNSAEVILYAPTLESFVKTRDILNKVVRKEGLEEGLSIGDVLRNFFATIARACKIEFQPDPKELTDLAAYVVGLKRSTDLKSPEVENARAMVVGVDIAQGR